MTDPQAEAVTFVGVGREEFGEVAMEVTKGEVPPVRIVWGDEVPGARELPAGHRLCFYGLTFGWLGIGVIRSVKRPSKARRGDE